MEETRTGELEIWSKDLGRFADKVKNCGGIMVILSLFLMLYALQQINQRVWSDFESYAFFVIFLFLFLGGCTFIVFALITGTYAERQGVVKELSENLEDSIINLERLQNLRDDQLKNNVTGDIIWEGLIIKAHADVDDARRTINEKLKDKKEQKERLDQAIIPEPWASGFCKKLFRYKEI